MVECLFFCSSSAVSLAMASACLPSGRSTPGRPSPPGACRSPPAGTPPRPPPGAGRGGGKGKWPALHRARPFRPAADKSAALYRQHTQAAAHPPNAPPLRAGRPRRCAAMTTAMATPMPARPVPWSSPQSAWACTQGLE
jgi:hypothetical protein